MKRRTPDGIRMARAMLVLLAVTGGCERQPAGGPAGMAANQARQSASGNAAADAAITARVKAALVADPELKSLEINIDTVNAAVTLSGTVDTPHRLERVTRVAKAVDGVKSVNNQLNVKAPT